MFYILGIIIICIGAVNLITSPAIASSILTMFTGMVVIILGAATE
jgi:uncharacterized membrane protein HdeD (DUF308 family)